MHVRTALAVVGAMSAITMMAMPGAANAGSSHDVIRADLLPSLPNFPAINGVLPGGAPWIIDRGEVRVRDSGRMDVRIEGVGAAPAGQPAPTPEKEDPSRQPRSTSRRDRRLLRGEQIENQLRALA